MDPRSQEPCVLWKKLFRKWKKTRSSNAKRKDMLSSVMAGFKSRRGRLTSSQVTPILSLSTQSLHMGTSDHNDQPIGHQLEQEDEEEEDAISASDAMTTALMADDVMVTNFMVTSGDLITSQIHTQEMARILHDNESMRSEINNDEEDNDNRMDWATSVAPTGDREGLSRFYCLVRRISLCNRISRLDNRRKKMLNMSASTSTLTSSVSVEEEMDQITYGGATYRQEDKRDGQISNECVAVDEDVNRKICAKLKVLEKILSGLSTSKPTTNISVFRSPLVNRKSVFRSFKDLFSVTQKFEKMPKRGLYLGAIVTSSDDNLLVTHQNALPLLMIDEDFKGTSLKSNFHWLIKVSCCWEDAKNLVALFSGACDESEVMRSRCRILTSVVMLQEILGLVNLGQVHLEPVYHRSTGSTVLLTVRRLDLYETFSSTQLRSISLNRFRQRQSSCQLNVTPEDVLRSEAEGMQALTHELLNSVTKQGISECYRPIARGLYVGYLKLRCCVESISIFVEASNPTVLPQVKVRDCPIVTRTEGEWLKRLANYSGSMATSAEELTFQKSLATACLKLLKELGVLDYMKHRLYSDRVLQLSDDVSMIILLPPVDQVCLLPGHDENHLEPSLHSCIDVPLHVFEIINLSTYRREVMRRYGKLSLSLDINLCQAQQSTRQAFTSEDLFFSKQHHHRLEKVHRNLEKVWRTVRWIPEVVSFARNKIGSSGVPLEKLLLPAQNMSQYK